MENLLIPFQETLARLQVAKNDRLLLAVSGGLDSVVLTYLSAMAGLDFGIAHANFQLRGDESERDEEFVRQLAMRLKKPFFTKRFPTEKFAEREKQSIQLAARNLRYEWFRSLLHEEPEGFRFLMTAHHLDDNMETMLMHFFRGTGIAGLAGMPEKNEWMVRPLLHISRSRLKNWAIAQPLEWAEDSSNLADDYTRNFFRHHLIPSLTGIFPALHQNLENNLQRFSETALLYQQIIRQHKEKLLKKSGDEIHIPILLLKKSHPLRTICYEIIKDFHFSPAQTDDLIRLMDASNGKFISSETNRIIKNRRWLIVAPLKSEEASHIIVEEDNNLIPYPEGMLRMKLMTGQDSGTIPTEAAAACLDAAKIRFPLILRKWKNGDYFYPLGMTKKKKLARFLIDRKLSKTAKEKIWVLVMDSQIIWVVGQRIDNRFAIRPSTQKIWMIKNEDV